MNIRGVLSVKRGEDFAITNEVLQSVEFCRNCGEVSTSTPTVRLPREGFECYHSSSGPR